MKAQVYDVGTHTYKDIPEAPFYVVATDKFMSGWGGAEGKVNRVICPCATEQEAHRVEDYAKERSEMRRVSTRKTVPRQEEGVIWSLVEGWVKTSQGYFRRD